MGEDKSAPKESYGSTNAREKGFMSEDELCNHEYNSEDPRSNNDARVNGKVVRSGMTVSGWGY